MTPILLTDGVFERDRILNLFEQESRDIDPDIVAFVTDTIRRYPDN